MQSLRDLQSVKDRFGGLVFLDYTAFDLQTAHRLLGQHVCAQVHKILNQRLEQQEPAKLSHLFRQARSCAEMLTDKLADQRLDSHLHGALQEYVDCLAAWADGAGLKDFSHPGLAAHGPLCTLDLALFLQHDSTGCQTGLYRQVDGSVILWHTEEDVEDVPGSGFDQLRLVLFNVGDEKQPVTLYAFVYPDLLPGPAFGWRSDGYTQAVDLLHTRQSKIHRSGILANILTWLTLRLGRACDLSRIIADMSPFLDGYALNAVFVRGGKVRAEKYEFAEDHILPHLLGEQPGSYLFQVNIFSRDDIPWVKEVEEIPLEDHKLYQERLKYTDTALQNKDHCKLDDMSFFYNLLTARSGTEWSYANMHVKAYFILHQAPQAGEIWLGYGPAIPGDRCSIYHVPLV